MSLDIPSNERPFKGIDLALKWRETFIENYPSPVINLMLPYDEIFLDEKTRIAIGSFTPEFLSGLSLEFPERDLTELGDDLENSLGRFPEGVFLRTGASSFKSDLSPILGGNTLTRLLDILSLPCKRATTFIADSLVNEYDLNLYAFPWRDILPWSEFRLFIRDRKVIGVSQYHHQEAYPEIQDNLDAIKASLLPFSRQLIEALHMDTVVADVFVERQEDGRFKTTLIELNPFIQRTDPCLFTWKNGGDFDGGFRYRKSHYSGSNALNMHQSSQPPGLFREDDYRRS